MSTIIIGRVRETERIRYMHLKLFPFEGLGWVGTQNTSESN